MKCVMHMGNRAGEKQLEALFEFCQDNENNSYHGLDCRIESYSESELFDIVKSYFWGKGDEVLFIIPNSIPSQIREKLMEIPGYQERRVEDKPVKVERRKSIDEKLVDLLKEAKKLEEEIDKQNN